VSLDIYNFWVSLIIMQRIIPRWKFLGIPDINAKDFFIPR
jgi:hypothetical protein